MPIAAVVPIECEAPFSRHQTKLRLVGAISPGMDRETRLEPDDVLASGTSFQDVFGVGAAAAANLAALTQAVSAAAHMDSFQGVGMGGDAALLANVAALTQAVSAAAYMDSLQALGMGADAAVYANVTALAQAISAAACIDSLQGLGGVDVEAAALANVAALTQAVSAAAYMESFQGLGVGVEIAALAKTAALTQAASAASIDIAWPTPPIGSASAWSSNSTRAMVEASQQILRESEIDLWRHFGLIGRPGLEDAPSYQDQIAFWGDVGEAGINWLIDRLREPADLRCIWAISGLLSDLAPASTSPILDRLDRAVTFNEALALLSALEGVSAGSVNEAQRLRAYHLLTRYLLHADDAIRGKAAAATAILDRESALELLRHALAREKDDDVRLSLEEELAARGCQ